jgi:peptide/nickel transport system substrate-binding protein
VQYGGRNYTLLRPADEAGDCDGVTSALGAATATSGTTTDSDGDTGDIALIGAGAVVLLALAGGGFWAFRRRATAGDRE